MAKRYTYRVTFENDGYGPGRHNTIITAESPAEALRKFKKMEHLKGSYDIKVERRVTDRKSSYKRGNK